MQYSFIITRSMEKENDTRRRHLRGYTPKNRTALIFVDQCMCHGVWISVLGKCQNNTVTLHTPKLITDIFLCIILCRSYTVYVFEVVCHQQMKLNVELHDLFFKNVTLSTSLDLLSFIPCVHIEKTDDNNIRL